MKRYHKIVFCLVIFLISNSCKVSIKPYERIYIDDPRMQMHITEDMSFQHYVHSIREGSVMTQAEKGNGGCGCN